VLGFAALSPTYALFLARLILLLDRCHVQIDPLMESISNVVRWVAGDHDALVLV
jgi:hypothetical protein